MPDAPENLSLFDVEMMGIPEFTGVYLLQGREPVLVDTGTAASAGALVAWLREKGQPRYVIITHVHYDHIGGLEAVVRAFPRVEVIATEACAHRLQDPDRYNRIYTTESFAPVLNVRTVREGEELAAGGVHLRFHQTPGHSLDSLSVHELVSDTLFLGDLPGDFLWGRTFLPPNASEDFDDGAYQASMTRMMNVRARCVALAHYGFFFGRDAEVMLRAQMDSHALWKRELLAAYGRAGSVGDVAARVRAFLEGTPFASLEQFEPVTEAFAQWCMLGYRNAGLVEESG